MEIDGLGPWPANVAEGCSALRLSSEEETKWPCTSDSLPEGALEVISGSGSSTGNAASLSSPGRETARRALQTARKTDKMRHVFSLTRSLATYHSSGLG